MKLADFNALCAREWNKPRRGDVVSLRLTEASRQELHQDALVNGSPFRGMRMTAEECARLRAGGLLEQLPNPVTRTVVKIQTKPDGERDTARVAVVGGTYRSTWRAVQDSISA